MKKRLIIAATVLLGIAGLSACDPIYVGPRTGVCATTETWPDGFERCFDSQPIEVLDPPPPCPLVVQPDGTAIHVCPE